jgi:serpin B
MLTEAPTLDEETIAEIANTIYVNSGMGYELQQGFIDKLNEFYDAQPETRNFHDGETWNVINQWANDHTHGMIPKIFASKDAFNEYAASYLLNAIYFKGVWANMFDKANTREEVFNGGETVPMMRQEEEYEYAENNLYQAVRLPYGNGAYQMTVFLPREDKTIDDVLATIDGHNWQFQKDGRFMVDLKLPRFKTETGLKLVPVMADLGMPSAFSEVAEFPYFCNRPVFIGDMFQKAVIDLDEEGTKAAAVTIIEVATSMPCEATFHANRPFFYIISERSTGVIFFIGQYTGSTTANILQTENSKNAKDNPTIYDLQGRIVLNGQLKKGLYIVGGKKVIVNRR